MTRLAPPAWVRWFGALGALLAAAGPGCVGTSGGELLDFPAAAAGPADAGSADSLAFTSDRGFRVVLTRAVLHIGAVYLDASRPVSGAQATNCVLDPSTYVAEVTPPAATQGGLDVDLLSATPQPFPVTGRGTSADALIGQLWLTGGDINESSDSTPILTLAGTTTDANGTTTPFSALITIGANRQASGSEAAGGDPICKERIVSVPVSLRVQSAGGLLVRIDPRLLFLKVDFSALGNDPGGAVFSDDPSSSSYTAPSRQLYQNLHSSGALYTFTWSDSL